MNITNKKLIFILFSLTFGLTENCAALHGKVAPQNQPTLRKKSSLRRQNPKKKKELLKNCAKFGLPIIVIAGGLACFLNRHKLKSFLNPAPENQSPFDPESFLEAEVEHKAKIPFIKEIRALCTTEESITEVFSEEILNTLDINELVIKSVELKKRIIKEMLSQLDKNDKELLLHIKGSNLFSLSAEELLKRKKKIILIGQIRSIFKGNDYSIENLINENLDSLKQTKEDLDKVQKMSLGDEKVLALLLKNPIKDPPSFQIRWPIIIKILILTKNTGIQLICDETNTKISFTQNIDAIKYMLNLSPEALNKIHMDII